jgi:hypothetical protein
MAGTSGTTTANVSKTVLHAVLGERAAGLYGPQVTIGKTPADRSGNAVAFMQRDS